MPEQTVFDDPTYQEMNDRFDPTGFERDVDTFIVCDGSLTCVCDFCLPF